jgi:hypothetical protein
MPEAVRQQRANNTDTTYLLDHWERTGDDYLRLVSGRLKQALSLISAGPVVFGTIILTGIIGLCFVFQALSAVIP